MEPWTRRFRLRWRPSVAFFEKRDAILRELEDAQLLRQFRVFPDRVSLRLGDAHHLLMFGSEQLDVGTLRPDGDMDRLRTGIQRVWDSINPAPARRCHSSFQWLDPMSESYDDARRTGADRILPLPPGPSHRDFALAFDGEFEDLSARYHWEAGIVEAAEAGGRLARIQRGPPEPEIAPTLWPVDTLPDVALFCDQDWDFEQDIESVDALFDAWATVEGVGHGVFLAIREHVIGGSG